MTQERRGEDRLLVERRVLGFGFKTTSVGANLVDVQLQSALPDEGETARLSFPEVQGIDALVQDLQAAFLTGLGTDPLNLDFGFDGARAISEETQRGVLAERLRASAAAVLVREPRVRQVVSVTLGYGTEGAAPDDNAKGRPTDAVITCTFDTVLGRRETIDVTGGIA